MTAPATPATPADWIPPLRHLGLEAARRGDIAQARRLPIQPWIHAVTDRQAPPELAADLRDIWGAVAADLPEPRSDDEHAWRAAWTREPDDLPEAIRIDADGPLLPPTAETALEVWTESELSTLHAVDQLAVDRADDAWRQRVRRARAWHLRHTQPDNATNRPWAIAVFLETGTPDARLYAETLLHNCRADGGYPDPLSGLVLLHVSLRLEGGRSGA